MQIQQKINLLPYNTFHISVLAQSFVAIRSAADIIDVVKDNLLQEPYLILGWGSNMLFTTVSFEGLVIKNEIVGKEILSESEEKIHIKVWGGENRNDFVQRTLNQGYTWLENLISIPGTVGACPVQNIWAYGKEVQEHILEVHGVYLDTPDTERDISISAGKGIEPQLEVLSNTQCQFGYRDSIFKHELKGKFFITHVVFSLEKYSVGRYTPQADYADITRKLEETWLKISDLTPQLLADIIAQIRAWKFPDLQKYGTAWSFFKNVVISAEKADELKQKYPDIVSYSVENWIKIPTWRLLDHGLGRKWKRIGNVWCREKQALVIVNYGDATGDEILSFSQQIQQEVYANFGIKIEPEVNIIQ